jgi:hypothetical protein
MYSEKYKLKSIEGSLTYCKLSKSKEQNIIKHLDI